MPAAAVTDNFEHFYEVAIVAVFEYANGPRLDYLGGRIRKNNWSEFVELASCWATDACQYRHPGTLQADIIAFKAQLLQEEVLEVVTARAIERVFGRFNKDCLRSSTWEHEQILEKMRHLNDLIVERGGAAHAFLLMDDTSHRYILHAIEDECEVARQSGQTIDFDEIAEQMLFEVGRSAQEHFVHLALTAGEQYLGDAWPGDIAPRKRKSNRQHLQQLATKLGINHVNGCRPQALSADVAYFKQRLLEHDVLDTSKHH